MQSSLQHSMENRARKLRFGRSVNSQDRLDPSAA